ncbi:unnamed protein product [Rhizophagus irregularis]|uniref:Uncharacterized protein n=1 Tax=Rhizophagus irregularis TaxID=588596 RepID=A0A915ZS38_9GLOM|nr:unnamed protein product [Rhizophagus irregularis]
MKEASKRSRLSVLIPINTIFGVKLKQYPGIHMTNAVQRGCNVQMQIMQPGWELAYSPYNNYLICYSLKYLHILTGISESHLWEKITAPIETFVIE